MRNFRFFSLLLVAAFACAQTPTPRTSAPTIADAVAAIRAYAPKALEEQGAPGMSVAITDGTHTIDVISSGLADVATATPVTADTRFAIGSITKSMTAIALLEQHDAGLIDLNAPVTRYLPSFSIHSHGAPVLIRQLLSHTAGIPDDYTLVGTTGYSVAALRNTHVIFAPGTTWSYSNDGFATLGEVVANVSKSTWQHDVVKTVLGPLDMNSTSAYFDSRTLDRAATGYVFRDEDRVAVPPHPQLMPAARVDFVNSAGSVLSNAYDMARYMRFFINRGKTSNGRQLISPSSFEAMTTPAHLSDGKPAGPHGPLLAEWPGLFEYYGYGMGISQSEGGDRLIGHTGGVSGYTACMQINLTRGFGVAAMSNLVEAPLHPCAIVKYAMAVLRAQRLGQPLPAPPAGPPIPPPVPVAAQFLGTYKTPAGTAVVVGDDENGMFLRDVQRYRLVEQAPDYFWTDDPRFTVYPIAFERNAQKLVDAFTNGPALFTNARYAGPRKFAHPAKWNQLTGRYEATTFDGSPINVRIVVVKNRLTVDGLSALDPGPRGTYKLGESSLRFDTLFQKKMQRLWLDGTALYRIDLP